MGAEADNGEAQKAAFKQEVLANSPLNIEIELSKQKLEELNAKSAFVILGLGKRDTRSLTEDDVKAAA